MNKKFILSMITLFCLFFNTAQSWAQQAPQQNSSADVSATLTEYVNVGSVNNSYSASVNILDNGNLSNVISPTFHIESNVDDDHRYNAAVRAKVKLSPGAAPTENAFKGIVGSSSGRILLVKTDAIHDQNSIDNALNLDQAPQASLNPNMIAFKVDFTSSSEDVPGFLLVSSSTGPYFYQFVFEGNGYGWVTASIQEAIEGTFGLTSDTAGTYEATIYCDIQ